MAKLKLKHNNSIYSVTDDTVRDGEIAAILNNGGVKNLISCLYGTRQTISGTIIKSAAGLTFTITPYKITISGVATDNIDFWDIALLAPRLPAGEYACTCTFSTSYDSTKFFFIETRHWNSVMDGYDHICTLNANEDLALLPCIRTGANFSTPIDFYPMIRDARISDPTYAPCTMTNRELTNSIEKVVDIGEITGGIGAAWDLLTVYDKPVMCCWGESGKHLGMLYKYSDGNYGMGFCQAYYSNSIITLSVSGGVKTTKTINPNT